jgi:anti-sigma B factor antagonist
MSLKIGEREVEGITILDLEGDLTLGEEDSCLRDKLLTLDQAGKVKIILNLKHAGRIDSAGVGTLVATRSRLRNVNGNLVLENLNKSHLQLLVLARVAMEFEIYDDEQDAVDSFFPGREVKSFDVLKFVQQNDVQQNDAKPAAGNE